MRVGILGLLHESNTFIGRETTIDHFQQDAWLLGDAVADYFRESPHEIGGFFAGLAQARMTPVPLFAARAMPYGTVSSEAFDRLLEQMFEQLDEARPLDGLLVAAHGAMASARQADADGYWLSRLRQHVGPHTAIIGTLDPHANLSPRMVQACDGLIPYRTNPHIDQRERGLEAADLLARTLRGAVRPTQAASMPPMAMDIECQRTSEPPCRPIYELASQLQSDPGVLSASILLGFPYADVPEMGSAALCITDDDPDLARQISHQLGKRLWHDRHNMVGRHVTIDEALCEAANLTGPVLLLDMGDNVGGGSPGDSTHLSGAIVQRRIEKSFVCLFDPDSALQAQQAGAGSRLALRLGGKTDHRHGPPLDAECNVIGIYDGRFHEPETRHGGIQHFDQGLTAVVRTDDDVTFMLTSRRMAPFSLRQLTSCQVDPAAFHLIVAKGVNAPLAAYQSVCRHCIWVNTPGVTVADMTQLPYQKRRRPMFPFEPDTPWLRPGDSVI